MPKVSVIMPVYNGEKYIRESIDSIIFQTLKDWELIIVNEYGSNCKTTNIIKEYVKKDSRIKIIQNDSKLGISESLNIGILNSNGEYIARMDSDDISGKNRLKRQVEFLDSNSDIGAIGIQPTVFGDEHWEWNSEVDPEVIRAESIFFQPILHPTAMIRRDLIKNNNLSYNPNYNSAEDFDFFVRLLDYTSMTNLKDKSLFYYRRHINAFTNIRKDDGDKICKIVMNNTFQKLGLSFTGEELSILYLHTELERKDEISILEYIIKLDLLLKKILIANMKKSLYGMKELSMALNKRWLHSYHSMIIPAFGGENYIPKKLLWQFKSSIFWNRVFYVENKNDISESPIVSVVLPLYNGQNYIFESIFSIQNQSYDNWELIVVNDCSKDDGPLIVKEYMKHDYRIRIINNEENLKISKTLNNGIKNAKGIYIARMDDDDISVQYRFEKQLDIFKKFPDISVVGGWQQHFGNSDWLHAPYETPNEMKASLIFRCDVCHSVVMFKKSDFLENDLFYDPKRISEDYDLWVRASYKKLKFYTIQEILGFYRIDGSNITSGKIEKFDMEARQITANILKKNFNIDINKEDLILLASWSNPFQDILRVDRKDLLKREKELLDLIKTENIKYNNYNQESLEKILEERWKWANENKLVISLKEGSLSSKKVYSITKKIFKKIFKKIKNVIIFPLYPIKKQLWDMDGHIWDYFDKLQNQMKLYKSSIEENNTILFCKMEEILARINANERNTSIKLLKIEEKLEYTMDDKLSKMEKNLGQQIDSRLSTLENLFMQQIDSRVWKAEENLGQQIDSRIWKAEENLGQQIDSRVWKTELYLKKEILSAIWNLDRKLNLNSRLNDVAGKTSDIYNEYFYEDNQYGSYMSGVEVMKKLLPMLKSKSIIDFGCGTGTWLFAAKKINKDLNILGIDGEYVDRDFLLIDNNDFLPYNLTEYFNLNKKFDLAISMEVAEHLDESYADIFLDNICRHSDIVLFSAAHIGQGGDGHINEQPMTYWIEKFEKRDYKWIDIRHIYEKNYSIEDYYKENMGLYIKSSNNDIYVHISDYLSTVL